MNRPNRNTANHVASLLLLLAIAVPLALPFVVPHAARAAEEFGGVGIPETEFGDDFSSPTDSSAGVDPLGGPGGTGNPALAGATCAASVAGYIPLVNTFTSVFSGQAPTKDDASVLGLITNCAMTVMNFVKNTFTAVNTTVTAGGIGYLVAKSKLDAIATGILKTAIKVTRNMVLRWIITGRFEGPVFVTSFSADAAQIAENASRIFLSNLTRINFCDFIGPPAPETFVISADFNLSCTLGDRINENYTDFLITLATNPGAVSLADRLGITDPQNNTIYNNIQLIDERDKAVARALIARSAEVLTGQGFLCLRDENTGRCQTPGSFVGRQVMASLIEGPIAEASVAGTVQQAIAEIIDTAIRVNIERGLAGTLQPNRR